MTNLVLNDNGSAVTNSLLVAEKFGKEHRTVLRAIRNLISTTQNCAVRNMFAESNYLNDQNKQQPMYIMNRDGFTLLVMGFNGKKALDFKVQFIEAFNRMEEAIKNSSYQIPGRFSEALRLVADHMDKVEHLESKLIEAEPLIELGKRLKTSNHCIRISHLARLLNQNGVDIGEVRLFAWMRENGYLHSTGEDYNAPTQKALDLKILISTPGKKAQTRNGREIVYHVTEVTPKGVEYFLKKFHLIKEPPQVTITN